MLRTRELKAETGGGGGGGGAGESIVLGVVKESTVATATVNVNAYS